MELKINEIIKLIIDAVMDEVQVRKNEDEIHVDYYIWGANSLAGRLIDKLLKKY